MTTQAVASGSSLTSIDYRSRENGRMAATVLVKLIEGAKNSALVTSALPSIGERSSCPDQIELKGDFMTSARKFQWIWPALLTPFDKQERVNLQARRLIELKLRKVSGFYATAHNQRCSCSRGRTMYEETVKAQSRVKLLYTCFIQPRAKLLQSIGKHRADAIIQYRHSITDSRLTRLVLLP